jgi:hypothetical protein
VVGALTARARRAGRAGMSLGQERHSGTGGMTTVLIGFTRMPPGNP